MKLYFHYEFSYQAQLLEGFYRQIAWCGLRWPMWLAILMVAFSPLPLSAQITLVPSNESSSQAHSSFQASSSMASNNSSHSKPAIIQPKHRETEPVNVDEWASLDKKSQQFLFPLKSVWQDLSKLQQRKWIAIAVQSGKMSTAEIKVLHQRMRDWALLSSSEREKARINFNKVNQLSSEEKLKNWQAYQALSEQEKASLIKKATPQKGLALQNASTAVQSKIKTNGVQINQSASPQHPAIAKSNLNTTTNNNTKTTDLKAKIQAGTLLPKTTTP